MPLGVVVLLGDTIPSSDAELLAVIVCDAVNEAMGLQVADRVGEPEPEWVGVIEGVEVTVA